ncbi:hypothetical protein [Flavobacterium agrisoli]|uniref:Uncharacterized protein n=1 Tax=Flavobacterium agrisoli TaxID=2793066 RepID=A0A934PPS7_9FLAO|nr:hypothetical protein [Flavobacterium agrisoli]MBK0370363.1 hypothetical protein [Flavobacterium agrisoli]
MEQNKVDAEFKKQLNLREIKPNTAAWDKLEMMLDAQQHQTKNQPKRSVFWYVAASFVGLALIGTYFLNEPKMEFKNLQNPVVIEAKKEGSVVNSRPQQETKVKNEKVENSHKVILKPETIVLLSTKEEKKVEQEKQIVPEKTQNSIKADSNVDLLLEEAEQNLAQRPSEINPNIKVDASKLLWQVDNELEPSFREKVIHKVSQNFHAVKVAISNRNIQDENHP